MTLEILESQIEGAKYGVFTNEPIAEGSGFTSNILKIPAGTGFPHTYTFDNEGLFRSIAVTEMTFANHSEEPNMTYALDLEAGTVTFTSLSDIESGAELTIKYAGSPDPLMVAVQERIDEAAEQSAE